MPTITQKIQHNSGIPLGGVGTGSVEIRPDGLFHEWEIANTGTWNPAAPCGRRDAVPMAPEDLVFMVRTREADGTIIARYLALREQLHDLYCLAWARCVQAISYEGTFPVATLTYHDPRLPVRIQAQVFSPFIPMEARLSGTPGFYVHFTVQNVTCEPVEVSIMGVARNMAGFGQEKRRPHNKLHELGETKAIVLAADGLAKGDCSTGDVTFAATGGDISYITGSFREDHKAMTFWRSRVGLKMLSFLHQFHDDGKLPNLNAELPPQIPKGFKAAKLSASERKKMLAELLQYPAFYDKYYRVSLADPKLANSPDFLDELADNVANLEERKAEWGWAALASSAELAPEAECSTLFTLSWHFPNHISPKGTNIGHAYANWFGNSLEVAEFLIGDFADLRQRTFDFAESIHGSSMPSEAADAVGAQLSTLVKCTWWTKAGHFGVWEGHGCCGFHTTDITYQGSFPIISLFPELQKAQMTHGASFQREDGRVHHFFTPDFSQVDNGFDRVDMNQQFVMLAARDYLWTGDKAYLKKLWPHIVRAMENTALLDTDGDGLPDTDTRRNTYDAWDFTGCPSYISSLWLGALKAAIRLGEEMNEAGRAAAWRKTYEEGVASFEAKLWNGEYYVLWRHGNDVDECCMSDQMSGDWFAGVVGWGPILKPARIKKALGSIMRYNFRASEGLLNATYPPGKKRKLAASGNYQADAPWTGIEYTVAPLLIQNGMAAEGLAIVQDIHERYMQAGRYWNHVECGGHYYRAMSSWTLLLALSGFTWDQPTGALAFAPAIDQEACEYPFFAGCAWGSFFQENGLAGRSVTIQVTDGEMAVTTLALPKLDWPGASVTLDGKEPACRLSRQGTGIKVTFTRPVKLTPGAALTVMG